MKTCGHINKQHYNAKGRLEDLKCDLEEGHKGDHHAIYEKNIPDYETDEKGRVTKAKYTQEPAEAYWNSDAGIPASEIKEMAAVQMSQWQKDILGDVLRKSPDLPIEQAIAQAKASPSWNALG
jgi:hypothetical protein